MSPQRAQRVLATKPRLNLSVARERAGLTIAQIAESTKISSRFLLAVEQENFSQLPGGIFATSYIRQYANAIGYDCAEILGVYYEALPGAAPVEAGRPVPSKEPARPGLLRWLGVSTAASRF